MIGESVGVKRGLGQGPRRGVGHTECVRKLFSDRIHQCVRGVRCVRQRLGQCDRLAIRGQKDVRLRLLETVRQRIQNNGCISDELEPPSRVEGRAYRKFYVSDVGGRHDSAHRQRRMNNCNGQPEAYYRGRGRCGVANDRDCHQKSSRILNLRTS